MEKGIGKVLFDSLLENKWIDVEYQQEEGNTHFWMAIQDVENLKEKKLKCKIINYFLNNAGKTFVNTKVIRDASINCDKIVRAKLITGSYNHSNPRLIDKINNFPQKYYFFEPEQFNENILKYLSECNEYDNDPYITEAKNLEGFNFCNFKNGYSKLTDEQMEKFIDIILKVNYEDASKKLQKIEIGLSSLAIAIKNKKYVIGYRNVYVDFDTKEIYLAEKSTINKSFLIDGKKVNLYNYIQCDPTEFVEKYDDNIKEYKDMIMSNLGKNEIIDTREEIFIIKRDYICDLSKISNSIIQMEKEGSLTRPLKAYFGKNISKRKAKNKEPFIVIKDEFANVDQIRVVYNTMTNYITYVEGPPGTGKTKTIINVILSAMANDQTCLICSNNNKPIDDIYESIEFVHTTGEKVLFPIIRLGNNDVNSLAIKAIRHFYDEAIKIKSRKINPLLTEKSKNKGLSIFEDLKKTLEQYEIKLELLFEKHRLENMASYLKLHDEDDEVLSSLKKVDVQLEEFQDINDNYVKKLVIPADKNEDYKNYLYYKSMYFIKKLADDSNRDLVNIILMNDEEEALKEFNKYLSVDENLKKFISIFPIVLSTNIAANKLGSPMSHFDLCIMDEAGQCNIATSLVPIVRAKSLLLVGDENQLKPVIVLEDNLNKKLLEKYNISQEYNYINNSILSLMKNKDKTSKFIRLRYHYRCPKKIINFCNELFYDGKLIIENSNESNFKFYNVKNEQIAGLDNAYEEEAQAIVDLIIKNKYSDVTIITPFKNQADLLNKKLVENNLLNINAGTIHTVQGAEKNTVIFSAALCQKTGQRTFDWIKNNQQLINVGISRSKKDFIMFGDYEQLTRLDKNENSILKQLADYVKSNGEVSNIKHVEQVRTNFSNNSTSEKELYETLMPFFVINKELKLDKNRKVSETLGVPPKDYLNYYHKAEFDFVISEKKVFNSLQPLLVIELDGGEHISCENTIKNDRKKEIICNHNHVKLLRIPNSLRRDYVYVAKYLSSRLGIPNPSTLFDEIDD